MFLKIIFQLRIKTRICQHRKGYRRYFSISASSLTPFLKMVRKVETTFCYQKEKDLPPLGQLEKQLNKGLKTLKLIKLEYQNDTKGSNSTLDLKYIQSSQKKREMKALPDTKPVKSLSRTSAF